MSTANIGKNHVKLIVSLIFLAQLSILFSAFAHAATDAYPFTKGSTRFSLLIGSASAFDQNYTVFGLGFGYYVIDGLEAGLDVETWQGNSPRISRISPGFRYIFYSPGTIKPYAGAFYRKTFIQSFEDQNDVGVRAGGIFVAGRRSFFGAGAVYDAHISCDKSIYSSCSQIYPEILFEIIF